MSDWSLLRLFRRADKGNSHALPAQEMQIIAPATETASPADELVVSRKTLKPDPRMLHAIGRNHSFESAVADIVDNSIDAGAKTILIRFVRNEGELVGLQVVDDGRGMTDEEIDRAMTFGGQREYASSDLGHFGIGLKAASLGQAKSLTVLSRSQTGGGVGRRLQAERAASTFECDVLAREYTETVLDRTWTHLTTDTGTVVIWSEVKSFPTVLASVDTYLDDAITKLCRKLGLIFHRILAAKAIRIVVDQEDIASSETLTPFFVEPIDPFAYPKSGRTDYPRALTAEAAGKSLTLNCHIWPGRSNHSNFKLPGGRADEFQGFFIYRNDRLLQCGGWQGIAHHTDELQLARICLDISTDTAPWFEMNPEKTQVAFADQFKRLVRDAADASVSFPKFLSDAEGTYRESRKRVRARPKVLLPGSGIPPAVKAAISDEYDFLTEREALRIRWSEMEGNTFFEVDKESSEIRLNRRFRSMVIGAGQVGSLNDAPLIKALIYLLAESALRGEILGSRDKDYIAIWQNVLTAAALAEMK